MKDYLSNLKTVLPHQRDTVWIGTVNPNGSPRLSARVVLGTAENRVYLCSVTGQSNLDANGARTGKGAMCAAHAGERRGSQLKGSFTFHTSGPIYEQYTRVATRLGFPRPQHIVEFSPYLEYSVAPSPASYDPRTV